MSCDTTKLVKKKLIKDYTGKKVGVHQCIEYIGSDDASRAHYKFECGTCGKEFIATISQAENYKGCGCIKVEVTKAMGKASGKQKDMINTTFEMLTVLREDPIRREGTGNIYYYVQCSCGSPEFSAQGAHLKSGGITSCGCKNRSASCDLFLAELQKEIDIEIEAREVPLSQLMDTSLKYRYDAIIPAMHVLIEVDGKHAHGETRVFKGPDNDLEKNAYAELLGYFLYRFSCDSVDDVPVALVRNRYMINKLKKHVADFKRV